MGTVFIWLGILVGFFVAIQSLRLPGGSYQGLNPRPQIPSQVGHIDPLWEKFSFVFAVVRDCRRIDSHLSR